MAKKVFCDNLVIEVGRNCNLQCCHCLRGDREEKTVDVSLVKKFLRKEISGIRNVTFTGGEPTLYEKEIISIIDYIIERKIPCESFYIASNGIIKATKLMQKLVEFYAHIQEVSGCGYESQFELSNDEFHEEVPRKNKFYYQAFSFYSERTYADYANGYWISEGRAVLNGLSGGKEVDKQKAFYISDEWEDEIEIEMIYFNAEGYLLPDCDYSYDTQRAMHPFAYGEKPLVDILLTYNKNN